MGVLIFIIVLLLIIGFVATYPFIGIPIIVILVIIAIIKRKSLKAWYDSLPDYEEQKKKNDSTDTSVNQWKKPFGRWTERELSKQGQEERYRRSIYDDIRILNIDETSGVALIVGTQGTVYDVTLDSCNCPDFEHRHLPCKHIYLLARKNYEKQETKTDNDNSKKTDEAVSADKSSDYKHLGYDPNALDFEDEHEKDIERWRNKIEKMEDSAHDKENPDDVISTLRKAVALCDDFREFCSLYTGGTSYYDAYEADDKERIERDIEDYIENEYEDAKTEYEELQQAKKEYSALKRKILKAITLSENGLVHKDIVALTSPENKNLAERALKELVNSESISKEKRGNRWVYFV
ncbi:MAG: SWIM zinc finger domain-containing protein [Oscillospiraceae bacterium]|nr:SWIM zinc finger domain-containing protein [Oscillospiraceae bacterium]